MENSRIAPVYYKALVCLLRGMESKDSSNQVDGTRFQRQLRKHWRAYFRLMLKIQAIRLANGHRLPTRPIWQL